MHFLIYDYEILILRKQMDMSMFEILLKLEESIIVDSLNKKSVAESHFSNALCRLNDLILYRDFGGYVN